MCTYCQEVSILPEMIICIAKIIVIEQKKTHKMRWSVCRKIVSLANDLMGSFFFIADWQVLTIEELSNTQINRKTNIDLQFSTISVKNECLFE